MRFNFFLILCFLLGSVSVMAPPCSDQHIEVEYKKFRDFVTSLKEKIDCCENQDEKKDFALDMVFVCRNVLFLLFRDYLHPLGLSLCGIATLEEFRRFAQQTELVQCAFLVKADDGASLFSEALSLDALGRMKKYGFWSKEDFTAQIEAAARERRRAPKEVSAGELVTPASVARKTSRLGRVCVVPPEKTVFAARSSRDVKPLPARGSAPRRFFYEAPSCLGTLPSIAKKSSCKVLYVLLGSNSSSAKTGK